MLDMSWTLIKELVSVCAVCLYVHVCVCMCVCLCLSVCVYMTVWMFVDNITCIPIVILMQIPTNVVTEMAVVLKVATTQLAATIVCVALDILCLPIAMVAMVSIMTKSCTM